MLVLLHESREHKRVRVASGPREGNGSLVLPRKEARKQHPVGDRIYVRFNVLRTYMLHTYTIDRRESAPCMQLRRASARIRWMRPAPLRFSSPVGLSTQKPASHSWESLDPMRGVWRQLVCT